MYRVLVVDDEKFVRKSIINRINWGKLELKVVGEADNGQAALELINVVKPDIVLVDIKMPLMSGIELIRNVRNQSVNIQFIILSGYNDFEYTKEAIKLGVANYIKKPIDEKELEETLLLIINGFQHKQKNETILKELTQQVESSNSELQEGYLNKLIGGDIQYAQLNLIFPYTYFTMILVHVSAIDSINGLVTQLREQTPSLLDQAGLTQSGKQVKAFIFRNQEYTPEIRILVNHCTLDTSYSHRLAQNLHEGMAALAGISTPSCKINISISSHCSRIDDIQLIYREALHILKHKIFGCKGYIIDKSVISQTDNTFADYNYNLLTLVHQALENRNLTEFNRILGKIFTCQNSQEKFSVDLLESVVLELANMLKKLTVKFGSDTPDQRYNVLYTPFYLLQFDSLTSLKNHLSGIMCSFFTDSPQMEEENIVARIRQYISSNYESALSLQRIAEEFYLNPSYLSQLFKSKTNENLSKYIEDVRIEKAKELLERLKLSVIDVAFHVGYNDANYFSKVFKKKVGISPSRFQEDLMQKRGKG